MSGRRSADDIRAAFEERWRDGDPWDVESSELDRGSYARQVELVADRHYARALELGCGGGVFTRMLAPLCERLLAVDVAPSAVERARAAGGPPGVEFLAADALELDLAGPGPWGLVVMSETVYCLGWAYPLFDLAWFAAEVHRATSPGGRLLMANTYGRPTDHLLTPALIDTYRDLFRNVGYAVEHEEVLAGHKDGVRFDVLITLFTR